MMQNILSALAYLFFLFGITTANVALGSNAQISRIEVLEDVHDSMTINEAIASASWRTLPDANINLGYSESSFWLRIVLDRAPGAESYLIVENPKIYKVEMYHLRPDGGFYTETYGYLVGNSNVFGSRYFIFGLHDTTPESIYMKVASRTPLQIPIVIENSQAIVQQTVMEASAFSAMFGIIFVFSIYHFLIFMHVRHVAYLYYAAYGLSMAMLFITSEGLLPSITPVQVRPILIYLFSCVGFASLANFTRKLLLLQRSLPRLDKFLKYQAVAIMGVLFLAVFSDTSSWYILGSTLAGVIGFTCVLAAVLKIRQNDFSAIYLVAFFAPILGYALYLIQLIGWLPRNFLTMHAIHLGVVLEILIFSQVLALLINRLNKRILSKTKDLKNLNRSLSKEIAERRRIAEELEQQRTIVVYTAKIRALGTMTASIAHEVNSPLTVLSMSLERLHLIAESQDLPQARRESLQKLIEQSSRMVSRISKVVKNMLAYARNSTNDEPEAILPNKLVEDLLDFCHASLVHRGIQLSVGNIADVLISCRSSEIVQILQNLVNNAADALQNTKECLIRISCIPDREFVVFHVEDNGPGVPDELVPRLMNVSFTTKKKGEGTGLGLGICKMLAERNGGSMAYARKDGLTCFSLRLPRCELEQQDEQKSSLES